MGKIVGSLSGLLFLAMMQPALAARPLGPPIEELQSSPEMTRIVLAVAGEKEESPRIRFKISERFSGESPDELVLRMDKDTFADVNVGQSYVIAWTDMRKVRLLREGYEKDPDGPSIVKVRGLVSTALFEDSPEIRFLFTPSDSSSTQDAAEEINALLAQMLRDDYRSRDLVAGELVLKPELSKQMNRLQAGRLKQVLQTPGLSAQHRDYILQSALRLPEELRSPWLGEEYRRVIILHGTQYDLNSFVPGLVKNSATGLGRVGDQDDIELLSILLYANNPGVARAALASMDHFDSPAATAKAELAINRGWIHSQTRRVLEKYLEQSSARKN
jgi:hypothetical protein